MSAWGHRITRLAREPRRQPAYVYATYSEPERWVPYCNGAKGKCTEKPEYALTYNYVTGRAGRVSDATRHYCAHHAAECAKRHSIGLDEQPRITPHERRVDMIGEFLK